MGVRVFASAWVKPRAFDVLCLLNVCVAVWGLDSLWMVPFEFIYLEVTVPMLVSGLAVWLVMRTVLAGLYVAPDSAGRIIARWILVGGAAASLALGFLFVLSTRHGLEADHCMDLGKGYDYAKKVCIEAVPGAARSR